MFIAFPIAVAAAFYLEEFATESRWAEFVEVNINNLAAVPSIIFGLLGLAIILNMAGVPRGTAVAGGIVLALRTLPVIIISCRASIKAVPKASCKDGITKMFRFARKFGIFFISPNRLTFFSIPSFLMKGNRSCVFLPANSNFKRQPTSR